MFRVRCPSARGRSIRSAFSLVELLVVVGVLSVLLGFLLPSLAKTREGVRRTRSLANLRTLGQCLGIYADVHGGAYPFMDAGQPVSVGCNGTLSTSDYWHVQTLWPALLQAVVPWDGNVDVFLSPGASRPPASCGWPSSYLYSHSFVTRPSLWREGAEADPRLLAPTQIHELRYPAGKVLLWDSEVPYLLEEPGDHWPYQEVPLLFADGHAQLRRPADASEPVANPFTGGTTPLHNTRDGVHGRDY